jgi:phage terminase small subunit
MGLSLKQRKFIEAYKGNGTDACRLAGYAGDDNALGVMANKLLRLGKIKQAIEQRTDKQLQPLIMTRLDRQKFWSEITQNGQVDLKDRLRASELLGKSEADFTEVIRNTPQDFNTLAPEDKVTVLQQAVEVLKKYGN